jgi:signal transduction histidine kinase
MAQRPRAEHGGSAPDGMRPERQLLLRTEGFFACRTPAFVMTVGLLLVSIIGTVDILTGPYLSPSLFYLLPVALVSWRLGRGMGGVIAIGASIMWFAAEVTSDVFPAHSLAPYWNVAVRFGVLFVVAALLATLKQNLQRQRDLADHETHAAEELRAMNEMKDTLLHAISHDLKGPITAIMGSAQTLARGEQLELTAEQRVALVNGIWVSGNKLNRIVSDLLDLERLDNGVVEPDCAPADITALARRLVEQADFLDEHPVRVMGESAVLSVDSGKIERILENLLVNAAKHTPVGTPVLVTVQPQKGGVTLSVEDEGPGIPEELKATIFQPFRQGTEARTRGTGAGIGLSLVKKFAELHGGTARVEDRAGGGTAFRVFLPGAITPSAPASVQMASAASLRR